MPNWCNNTVCFEASKATLKKIKSLFLTMAKKEQKWKSGQLPDFIIDQQDWFFEIRWEDDVLYYETRWSPNTHVVRQVADAFQCGYVHDFDELDMAIFGKTIYRNGQSTTVELDADDFNRFTYNEQQDCWEFEGVQFNSDYEILEILLEQKENNSKHH